MPDDSEAVASSKNGVCVRLTDERWLHIVEEHAELDGQRVEVLEAVADPESILMDNAGELLALRTQDDGKVLVAIYREFADDGFAISAFLTRRLAPLNRRTQVWPSLNSPNF